MFSFVARILQIENKDDKKLMNLLCLWFSYESSIQIIDRGRKLYLFFVPDEIRC